VTTEAKTGNCDRQVENKEYFMSRRALLGFLLFAFSMMPAQADSRFITRDSSGLSGMQAVCLALGCTVAESLDGSLGQVFLITTPDAVNSSTFLQVLLTQPGVVDAEPDQLAQTSRSGYTIPKSLSDTKPVDYFGQTVAEGYITQPAVDIIDLGRAQNTLHVKGAGIVAVIDTGIDPNHPVLKNMLVPGYDFTRNLDGEGDETADIILSGTPTVGSATWVNQQSAANVDQSTAAVVNGNPGYSAFGHGTMVAGIVHLVAPGASLMPLKAFRADGTGYNSEIIRAIYFAVFHNANILNMSFNVAAYSLELKEAVDFAAFKGLISVAAAGNSGKEILVYPAAFLTVMGIASTTNDDLRSSFSNYGNQLVWVAAPGEGIVTTYPFATYAAGWGTSFSTPFVAGTAALMLDVQTSCNESQGAQAMANAHFIDVTLGNGRLQAYQAVLAWSQMLGLQ
jgi:subtilisin family serine protease